MLEETLKYPEERLNFAENRLLFRFCRAIMDTENGEREAAGSKNKSWEDS